MKKNLITPDTDILSALGFSDPLKGLKDWLETAKNESRLKEPWAMSLSTSRSDTPSSRTVLLKKIEKESLIFFSNYLSEKGQDMEKNPRAAALFHWDSLEKQIRIQGAIKKTSRKLSEEYWNRRPKNSQLSGWISKQSHPLLSRKSLESLRIQAQEKFKNKKIPCPKHWGGYLLSIKKIEFWQGRPHRLHDRFLFEKKHSFWTCHRLFP